MEANLNLKTVHVIENAVTGAIFDSVKCGCPELTMDELREGFAAGPQLLLSFMSKDQSARATKMHALAAKCPDLKNYLGEVGADSNSTALEADNEALSLLPRTCTLESWKAGRGCSMQMPMDFLNLDMALTVTIAQCPSANSILPYVEVGCRGKGCVNWYEHTRGKHALWNTNPPPAPAMCTGARCATPTLTAAAATPSSAATLCSTRGTLPRRTTSRAPCTRLSSRTAR
jgi:hypothetical protein